MVTSGNEISRRSFLSRGAAGRRSRRPRSRRPEPAGRLLVQLRFADHHGVRLARPGVGTGHAQAGRHADRRDHRRDRRLLPAHQPLGHQRLPLRQRRLRPADGGGGRRQHPALPGPVDDPQLDLRHLDHDPAPEHQVPRRLGPRPRPWCRPTTTPSRTSALTGAGPRARSTSVTAPDAMTVVYKLQAPNPTFPAGLTTQVGYVVGQAMIDQANSAAPGCSSRSGTGPFIYSQWQPNSFFTATRNPNYWRTGLPYLDTDHLQAHPRHHPAGGDAAVRRGGHDRVGHPHDHHQLRGPVGLAAGRHPHRGHRRADLHLHHAELP